MNTQRSPIQLFPLLATQFCSVLHESTKNEQLDKVLNTYDPLLMVNVSLSINTDGYSSCAQASGYSGYKNEEVFQRFNNKFCNLNVPYLVPDDIFSGLTFDSEAGVSQAMYGAAELHIHPTQILVRCSAHTLLPIVTSFINELGKDLRFVDIQNLTHAIPAGGEKEAFNRLERVFTDTIYSHLKTHRKSQFIRVDSLRYTPYNIFGTQNSLKSDEVKGIAKVFDGLFNELKDKIINSPLVLSMSNGVDIGYRLVNKSEFKSLDAEVRTKALCSSNFLIENFY